MPEQQTTPDEDQEIQVEDAGISPRSSILAKIKIIGFVTAVIAVECVAAYLYLPSSTETVAMAEALAASSTESSEDEDAAEEEERELADQREVDLGEFSVVAFQPVSTTTLRIDFHLFGTVGTEDEEEFLNLLADNEHRFREQVNVIVRSANISDLTDAGLGLIKRRILEATNRIVRKQLLRTVIFSDFSFIEQ